MSTADYEQNEARAIASGKAALAEAPWISNRHVSRQGFFADLVANDAVHPNHYRVEAVDGIGTKLFFTAWKQKFPKVFQRMMQNGIAMSANDIGTVIHALIDTTTLYLACQAKIEEQFMGPIMEGFRDSLAQCMVPDAPFNPNKGKLETASLDEMISLGVPGMGWDVGVTMTAYIEKQKVPLLNPKRGHVIVGISAPGLNSNGYTGARHVLFASRHAPDHRPEMRRLYHGQFSLDSKPEILNGKTVFEALEEPTPIYFADAAAISRAFPESEDIYGINITGNGLKNFNRAGSEVEFHITDPLPPQPIHLLVAAESEWSPETAYKKINMGMGYAYIAPDLNVAERMVEVINGRGVSEAKIVGQVEKSKAGQLQTILHKPYEGKRAIPFVGY